MLNNINIQGRLVRAPELKHTANGVPVTSFTIACERNYLSNGEKLTDFVDCVAWRQLAERICKHWGKGKEIILVGSLESRKYQDKNGNSRTAWEVKATDAYFTDKVQRQEKTEGGETEDYNFSPLVVSDDEDLPF